MSDFFEAELATPAGNTANPYDLAIMEPAGVQDLVIIDETYTLGDVLREIAMGNVDQVTGAYVNQGGSACGVGALYLGLTARGYIEDPNLTFE